MRRELRKNKEKVDNMILVPLRNKVREDVAQTDNEVGRPQVALVHRVKVLPGRSAGKEFVLLDAGLGPSDTVLQVGRRGLFDTEPIILQCLFLISDELDPSVLVAWVDTVRLSKHT